MTPNPALKHSIRRAFKGIAGRIDPDLEDRAIRAIGQRHIRKVKRDSLRRQAELRKAAVERRKKHQMQAADYARDRRATQQKEEA